jgi:hypothetical protein
MLIKTLPLLEEWGQSMCSGQIIGIIQSSKGTRWYKPTIDYLLQAIEELDEFGIFVAVNFLCGNLLESVEDEEKKRLVEWIYRMTERMGETERKIILEKFEPPGEVQ